MKKLVLKKMMIVLVSMFYFSPISAQVSQQQSRARFYHVDSYMNIPNDDKNLPTYLDECL